MFLKTAIAQRKSLAFPYLIFSKARQRLLHHAELKLGHGPYQHLSLEPLIVHVLFFFFAVDAQVYYCNSLRSHIAKLCQLSHTLDRSLVIWSASPLNQTRSRDNRYCITSVR